MQYAIIMLMALTVNFETVLSPTLSVCADISLTCSFSECSNACPKKENGENSH